MRGGGREKERQRDGNQSKSESEGEIKRSVPFQVFVSVRVCVCSQAVNKSL